MIDTDKYEERIKSIPIRKLKVGCTLLVDSAFLRDAGLELLTEVKRLRALLEWYEEYDICHPNAQHCCDDCLERNGFEVEE